MTERLHVGVMGAGSIGGFVGGRLVAADAAQVTFVGRARTREEFTTHGLTLSSLDRKGALRVPPERVQVATEVAALSACDAVLVCVKSAQTAEVAEQLDACLGPDVVLASLQNGVRNAPALRARLGSRSVMAGIVGFNVVSQGAGRFHQGTSGPLSLEAPRGPVEAALVRALERTGLTTETHADLAPHQWTKLLVNLNNAVSALSGAPTRDLLVVPAYRRVVAAVVAEGLAVLGAAGIRVAPLRGIPMGVMPMVLRLPTPLVRLVTRRQMRVDPHARSSMWEDLERRRPTEVDFLNGEIVTVADRVGVDAPVNRRIVARVREAERAGAGSPGLSGEALWRAVGGE